MKLKNRNRKTMKMSTATSATTMMITLVVSMLGLPPLPGWANRVIAVDSVTASVLSDVFIGSGGSRRLLVEVVFRQVALFGAPAGRQDHDHRDNGRKPAAAEQQ